jgi:hypothetical protein
MRIDYVTMPMSDHGSDAVKNLVSFSVRYGSIVGLQREALSLNSQVRGKARKAKKQDKPIPVIAIMNFSVGEASYYRADADLLKELFQAFIVQTGAAAVVERSQLDLIYEQQKDQLKDIFGEERDKRLAQMAGAEYILVGNYGWKFGKMELRIEGLHVGMGKTMFIEKISTRDPKSELFEMANVLSQRVALKIFKAIVDEK